MADFFYSSSGVPVAPYNSWVTASTSLATVAAAMSAGDTLYMDAASNESVAGAITATFPGTSASPNLWYLVTPSGASGNSGVATGSAGVGSVTTTGNNAITLNGSFYCYGVFISAGNGANSVSLTVANTAENTQKFENCVLKTGGTSGGVLGLGAGANPSIVTLVSCTLTVSAAGSTIRCGGRIYVSGGSITGTAQTTFFAAGSTSGAIVVFEGFDYSNLGNHTLFGNPIGGVSNFVMKDCKAPASYTRQTTLTIAGLVENYIIRSDSSATNYIQEKYNYWGSQVANTSIYRTGGASDGTTPISWTVTPLNTSWPEPFVCIPITIWNTTVTPTAVNVTVHATSNLAAGAFPNNDDIWISAEGLGTSGNPKGIYSTNTKANPLASNSAYTNDSTSWNSAPAGGTFAMTASFTLQQAGPITVYVNVAKTSTIFYVDPLIVLS